MGSQHQGWNTGKFGVPGRLGGLHRARDPLPVTFFLGKGIESRSNLGIVPGVGVEKVAESQELSDFLHGCGQRCVLYCFQLVGTRRNAGSS